MFLCIYITIYIAVFFENKISLEVIAQSIALVIFHPIFLATYFCMFSISLGLAIFIYKQINEDKKTQLRRKE